MAGQRAVLIAGPTASGKSALALERAVKSGGMVINTDSMQVYDGLNILSARPQTADLVAAEHRLYGFVTPSERFSTGQWAAAVLALLAAPESQGRDLIFVGGTGLYFETLTKGIAFIPEVPTEKVAEMEALVRPLDRIGRLALLAQMDPLMAARLAEPDPQRLIRALSVLSATGRSLAEWQDDSAPALLEGYELECLVLDVGRDVLAERIARRFKQMMEAGAIAEVEALRARSLTPNLPAMKAIGVAQIGAWLDGEISREAAVEHAVIATRQYAKRQRTWFRQRMSDWLWIDAKAPSS